MPLTTVPSGAPRRFSRISLRIGAGDRVHGVEAHAEAAGEHGADRVEVEQRLHQRGIVGDRVDHLDGHVAGLDGADRVEVDVAAMSAIL